MVSMHKVVFAVVQKNLPLKQKDLDAFTIQCFIGNASFKIALYDLDASISVMPKHVYDFLSLELLIKTSIIIQLMDHSFIYPLGVIEDFLVKTKSFVISCDVYILDMECDSSNNVILDMTFFNNGLPNNIRVLFDESQESHFISKI